MKEIFKNETKCSKKEYKLFIDAHDKEFGFSEELCTIIQIAFFICFIIYAFMNNVFIFGYIISIMLIIFITYKIMYPRFVIKKETKSKKIQNQYKNIYNFYKYSFTIKNKEGQLRIFYFKIHRVLENDTHFYIYLTKTKAFVVSKEGFIKGDSKEFSRFLRKRVWFRYKNKCNKKASDKK